MLREGSAFGRVREVLGFRGTPSGSGDRPASRRAGGRRGVAHATQRPSASNTPVVRSLVTVTRPSRRTSYVAALRGWTRAPGSLLLETACPRDQGPRSLRAAPSPGLGCPLPADAGDETKTVTDERRPMQQRWECVDGNEAAARVAYRLSEGIAIYPITPASPMAELADDWSAAGRTNLWGGVPRWWRCSPKPARLGAARRQPEGALATTFTASQGLLLMVPNMFKIAGELTPAVIHVAARTVATHACRSSATTAT